MGDDEFQIPENTEFTVEDLHRLESGFDSWDDETQIDNEVLAWASTLPLPSNVEGVDHSLDHQFHSGEAIA